MKKLLLTLITTLICLVSTSQVFTYYFDPTTFTIPMSVYSDDNSIYILNQISITEHNYFYVNKIDTLGNSTWVSDTTHFAYAHNGTLANFNSYFSTRNDTIYVFMGENHIYNMHRLSSDGSYLDSIVIVNAPIWRIRYTPDNIYLLSWDKINYSYANVYKLDYNGIMLDTFNIQNIDPWDFDIVSDYLYVGGDKVTGGGVIVEYNMTTDEYNTIYESAFHIHSFAKLDYGFTLAHSESNVFQVSSNDYSVLSVDNGGVVIDSVHIGQIKNYNSNNILTPESIMGHSYYSSTSDSGVVNITVIDPSGSITNQTHLTDVPSPHNINYTFNKHISTSSTSIYMIGRYDDYNYYIIRADINGQAYSPYTEINEYVENIQTNIYPNPCIDYINIDVDKDYENIYIYSIDGRLINTEKFKNKINVNYLIPGYYIISIDNKSYDKFVKK